MVVAADSPIRERRRAEILAAAGRLFAVRGVRSARKHVGWYLAGRPGAQGFLRDFNALDDAPAQLAAVERFLVQAGSFAAAKPVSGAANDTRFLGSYAA